MFSAVQPTHVPWVRTVRPAVVVLCALLGLVLLPARSLADGPDPPTRLVIEQPLLTKLQTLAAGLHVELVLCLQGVAAGNDMRLTDFSMPVPRVVTGDRSLYLPCPDNTAAVWHNHPVSDPSTRPDTRRPRGEPVPPRDLCALSRSDIRTTSRLGYPFVVVSVDAQTWCWWTLEQVKRFEAQGSALGRPIAGQVSWFEPRARVTRRPS